MKTQQSIAISPFIYRKYEIRHDDSVKEATFGRMCSLQKERKLLKVHFDILRLFLKYKYLTRRQIEIALHFKDAVMPDDTTVSIKQALQYMNKNGMVKRYYFEIKDFNSKESDAACVSPPDSNNDIVTVSGDADNEDAIDQIDKEDPEDIDIDNINEVISRRSVNFYTLTKGSLAYVMSEFKNIEIGKIGKKEEELIELEPEEEILKKLSVVNFMLINTDLSHDTASFVPNCFYSAGKKQVKIDCYSTCVAPAGENRLKQNIFSVFSIRKIKDWGKSFVNLLNLYTDVFEAKIETKERNDIPAVIFICEEDEHIINCYREISQQKRDYKFNIFYTTDTRLHNIYLNRYLIHAEWDTENKCLYCKEILSTYFVD